MLNKFGKFFSTHQPATDLIFSLKINLLPEDRAIKKGFPFETPALGKGLLDKIYYEYFDDENAIQAFMSVRETYAARLNHFNWVRTFLNVAMGDIFEKIGQKLSDEFFGVFDAVMKINAESDHSELFNLHFFMLSLGSLIAFLIIKMMMNLVNALIDSELVKLCDLFAAKTDAATALGAEKFLDSERRKQKITSDKPFQFKTNELGQLALNLLFLPSSFLPSPQERYNNLKNNGIFSQAKRIANAPINDNSNDARSISNSKSNFH